MSLPLISIVIIGRNEGDRLLRCIDSVHAADYPQEKMELIYVDSNSSDGSPERAKAAGASILRVHPERPTAAIGRNAGWKAATGEYILFLDGDTLLDRNFIATALAQIETDKKTAVVWGHRREIHPQQSIYTRVLDLDWIYLAGKTKFCGGDALIRRRALEQVNGFDETLIAGEEPEMCRRMRQLNYEILHIDAPMTLHDLAIKNFTAYWRRAYRSGHAYAEISERFKASEDPLWKADARHNRIHGSLIFLSPLFLTIALLYPALGLVGIIGASSFILRNMHRNQWKTPSSWTRFLYALHSEFQHAPALAGQLRFFYARWRGQQQGLIEYHS
jgi:glycosyltransferase involved in cell wall biosynthesis